MKRNPIKVPSLAAIMGSLLWLLAIAMPLPAAGQTEDSAKNKDADHIYQTSLLDTLLQTDDILEVTLVGDWVTMDTARYTEDYRKARMEIRFSRHLAWDLKIKVRPRGKFRRKVCSFPPLKLNISDKALAALGLNDKFDKFKLVSDCLLDREGLGEDLVLREYLAYRLYNQVEPEKSYRVKLLRLTFKDEPTGMKWERYGFLIEDDKELANRLQSDICDCMNVHLEDMYPEVEAKVALFQYMISNPDWAYPGMRNLDLFYRDQEASPNYFAVPYDFDYSGLVNAPYAVPVSETGQTSIRERVFLGRMMDDQQLWAGLQPFLLKKESLLAKVEDFKAMSRSSRKDIAYYINSFYNEIGSILRNRDKNFASALTTPEKLRGRFKGISRAVISIDD